VDLVILDGTEPTFEKRSAPIGTIVQSLRPKGYQRETFAGRKAQALGPRQIAQMKSFVENSMKMLGVPGCRSRWWIPARWSSRADSA